MQNKKTKKQKQTKKKPNKDTNKKKQINIQKNAFKSFKNNIRFG